jgi:CRISPR-associated protein Cas5t
MLRLYLEAPFATFRPFIAGWYRPTAGFLTPSAAYGLVLNIARIESRLYEHDPEHDGRVPASLTRPELPPCRLAIGIPEGADPPQVQSLYQQLHNYPVGASAGVSEELAMGSKNNITPIRREVLVGVRAMIAVDAPEAGEFETRIIRGLRGELNEGRYGLPFLGDNNFLVDRLEITGASRRARWYQRVDPGDKQGPRMGVTRLTTRIDRADMSRTRSALYAPIDVPTIEPPDGAWTEVAG